MTSGKFIDPTALGQTSRQVRRFQGSEAPESSASDQLAVEEPLEIRLSWGEPDNRQSEAISITMRTPGQDIELALGFLYGEGIIRSADQLLEAAHQPDSSGRPDPNVVTISLKPGIDPQIDQLRRNFYTSSSCGVCGKGSLDAVRALQTQNLAGLNPVFESSTIHKLPAILMGDQSLFKNTGGIHAAGLFTQRGEAEWIYEDVGRHNAVDKVVGRALVEGRMPLAGDLLVVSGRASFELVQKTVAAGIPALVAVGAPSSLAVDLALEYGLTLMGFVREGRFNAYSRPKRILPG